MHNSKTIDLVDGGRITLPPVFDSSMNFNLFTATDDGYINVREKAIPAEFNMQSSGYKGGGCLDWIMLNASSPEEVFRLYTTGVKPKSIIEECGSIRKLRDLEYA